MNRSRWAWTWIGIDPLAAGTLSCSSSGRRPMNRWDSADAEWVYLAGALKIGASMMKWRFFLLLLMVGVPDELNSQNLRAGTIETSSHAVKDDAAVLERLITLLSEIPEFWNSLSESKVKVSGRGYAEVLENASEDEIRDLVSFFGELALTGQGEREAAISRRLEEVPPTEVSLFLPGYLIQRLQLDDPPLAIRTAELWLQWALAVGRRDTLLEAASSAINLIRDRLHPQRIVSILENWMELPVSAVTELGMARLRFSYGGLLFRLGEVKKALSAYREARRLFEAAGDQLGQGNTFRGEADVLSLLGETDGALSAYNKARKLFVAVGDRVGQGNTLRGEADLLFRLGDDKRALNAYREARKLFEATGVVIGQGSALLGEADVAFRLGEAKEALSVYKEARRLFEVIGDRIGQGNSLKREADVLFHLGDIEGALRAYREARKQFETIGEQFGRANTYLDEAAVLFQLGDTEGSLSAYREARRIFKTIGDQIGQGNALNGAASVLFFLDDTDGALSAYKEARKLFETVGDQIGQGNTFRGEADVLFVLGDIKRSLRALRKAREHYISVGDQLGQGSAWGSEARVLQRKGKQRKAAAAAARAVELHAATGHVHNHLISVLLQLRLHDRDKESEKVINLAHQAIELHDRHRRGYIAEQHRTEQDDDITIAYDHLVPILSRTPAHYEEALSRAEEARSQVLLDLLTAGRPGATGVPFELFAERARHLYRQAEIEHLLRSASDPARRRKLLAERDRRDDDLQWNLYLRLSAEASNTGDATPFGQPVTSSGLRELATVVGPILFYYTSDRETVGFLIDPERDGIHVAAIDIGREDLTDRVRDFATYLANPFFETRALAIGEDLWRQLVAPFAAHLPEYGPLVVIPHGPLHKLPFTALPYPATGRPLFERWHVSVAPSGSTLALARRQHRDQRGDDSFLAFSAGRGLILPELEVHDVADIFENPRVFAPEDVRIEIYKNNAPHARHLLIATRGVHHEGRRRSTYLEIRPTEGVHDSRLTSTEIAGIALDAELVTLAACDTASGQALLSDERLNITRSFLIAGASAVLATRWRVPEDASTSRFLLDFYRAYRQGGPEGKGMRKDEALTLARRQSIKRGDPASIWAAWVLVGDAR